MPQRRTAANRMPWVQQMAKAYHAVRYSEAAAIFDEHAMEAPPDAVLLRARVFLKNNEPAAVVALLASRRTADKRKRAEALMLLATAHTRMGRFQDADEEFESAASLVGASDDPELFAEIAYRRAVRFTSEKRSAEARKQIALARKSRSQQAQIWAAEAESFVLASESRYAEQARVLMDLLRTLDPAKGEFSESRAWATHTLATLARELYIPEAVPLVERHLESGNWIGALAVNRFQGFKAVGWAHALRGDYFSAFRFLKRSLEIAPAKEWVAMAHADRAYLAQCNREPLWSRQELAEAEESAAQVDWESMRGEEPIALLLIAELFAPTDPSRAAYYVARFDELGDGVRNRLLHFRNDARAEHLADYSRGIVELALGNKKRGIKLLEGTEQFFAEIGYEWRAGRCALELYRVTGNSAHLARAGERLRNYMGSWLGALLRESQQTSRNVRLGTMQRKVFEGICRGLSNAEIAREIQRSEFTVANHVKVLLKRFDVPSRAALMAEAMRRGLVRK